MLDVLEAKETPARHKSKKDTRRWCTGKVGREHVPYWDTRYWEHYPKNGEEVTFSVSQTQVCWKCKKHLIWRHKYITIAKGVFTVSDKHPRRIRP
jgi:hypothetical protein